jgi:hypothetical protein
MPNYEDYRRAKEQRRHEEEFKEEMNDFFEDMFGDYRFPEPEPKRYDPNDDSKQNFLLGLLGPVTKQGATQEELDAFEEQQALLQEQELEKDIAAGLYPNHPLSRMTKAQRREQYRRDAIDREQARWERNYEAQRKAKKRAARRQARDEGGRFAS